MGQAEEPKTIQTYMGFRASILFAFRISYWQFVSPNEGFVKIINPDYNGKGEILLLGKKLMYLIVRFSFQTRACNIWFFFFYGLMFGRWRAELADELCLKCMI